ncbi:MAG: vWA domain-containing protein [Cetobacterium sp.]
MEFKAQKKQVLPVIFLIDNSGSMDGYMSYLNDSVNIMLNTLKNQEALRAEINVAFITFGTKAELFTPLSSIYKISEVKFQANGLTPLGGALKIAKNLIEDREVIASNSFRPMIILLSDGYPTDDYEVNFNDFINQGRSQKCERISLGIGDSYDNEMLKKFSTEGQVFEAKDASKLIDFFKFITMTLKDKSISLNPNRTPMTHLENYKKSSSKKLVEDKEKVENYENAEHKNDEYSIFD